VTPPSLQQQSQITDDTTCPEPSSNADCRARDARDTVARAPRGGDRAGTRKGTDGMALGFYFAPGSFTPDRYDEAIKRLEAAGAGAPAGRTLHVALESEGKIQVFDIWESQEALDAFGATLIPILTELGVEPGEPMAARVHNVITG
jgi:hypothetical protein